MKSTECIYLWLSASQNKKTL